MSNLYTWTLNDFKKSGVDEDLMRANVKIESGQAALETLLGDRVAERQKNTQYATKSTAGLLKVYECIEDGMWVTRPELGNAYAKPINPRPDQHKIGKVVKYEGELGKPATPIMPSVTVQALRVICQIHGLEFSAALEAMGLSADGLADRSRIAHDVFWDWWISTGKPVSITEGLKKALSLIAHGYPAIAVRGITQWHQKGGLTLHPELERIATAGRRVFIFFDQDTKPKTVKDVQQQTTSLGNVLEAKDCRVFCPVWKSSEGKGVDDVIYAQGEDAHIWLEVTLTDAPTLRQYRRNAQIAKALNTLERLNHQVSYAIERDTKGEFLPQLPALTPGAIHVVNAMMNSGKTFRIGRDWVQPAIDRGEHVLWIPPLNSLGKQSATDIGGFHIHDRLKKDENGQINERQFWEDVRKRPAVIMCPDSIGQLPDWFWEKPVRLVLDEANQVTEHICQGNTLKNRYSPVLTKIQEAAQQAIRSGGCIILSEDGIPDRAVKFWQTISGSETVRYFRHKKELEPWDCQVFSGQVSGFRANLLQAAKKDHPILFTSSSQRECKRVHRLLTAMGLKGHRIDSETNQSGAYNDFFSNPDAWLHEHQPDFLILSPSAKSGVSIEGNVSAKDGYFKEVWGYFPALSTDTHLQLLGRYRPAVPRFIFTPPFIQRSPLESKYSAHAVKQRLLQDASEITQLTEFKGEEREISTLESEIAEYLAETQIVNGAQKQIAQAALIDRLERSGHIVRTEKLEADKDIKQLWDETQEGIWQEDAKEFAALIPADGQDAKWAWDTLDSMESTRENRLMARKILWREEFPGVLFNTPEECYEALFRDYGAMRKGVRLQTQAEFLEAVKQADSKATDDIMSATVRALHRLPKNYIRAGIIKHLGILDMLDGSTWTNQDSRAIEIKQRALKYAKEIGYWLRLQIKTDQTPSEIVNKLIKKLGLDTKAIGRPGKRNEKRDRVWMAIGLDSPVRAKLLKASRNRLSNPVSMICKEEKDHIQIMDTPPDILPMERAESGWQVGDAVQRISDGARAIVLSVRNSLLILEDWVTGRQFRASAEELMALEG
ncbi:MAG: DUF3854 domain-containing protein [Cyanobacteria bacterium P01_H01_bin.26]